MIARIIGLKFPTPGTCLSANDAAAINAVSSKPGQIAAFRAA
ncbi:hypothetical protein [Bosea psychrotolerans]|nr:hypothetical protein [Bosea psychrotolerans]